MFYYQQFVEALALVIHGPSLSSWRSLILFVPFPYTACGAASVHIFDVNALMAER
jgi:hypothetical protein